MQMVKGQVLYSKKKYAVRVNIIRSDVFIRKYLKFYFIILSFNDVYEPLVLYEV